MEFRVYGFRFQIDYMVFRCQTTYQDSGSTFVGRVPIDSMFGIIPDNKVGYGPECPKPYPESW